MLKPLPVGVQSFRDLIQGGYLYVDKTRLIYELIRYSKGVYFLARPRRFGKSLLISTLSEIFAGNRELFRGLWLYDSPYTWQTHPVIRIDFSRISVRSVAQLADAIDYYLTEIAETHGLALRGFDYQSRFDSLIRQLGQQGKAVILIDEYDKPIIDNIGDTDEAKRILDALKGFYTVIKALDEDIRFVFLTGISRFTRVGVFSGLNNLDDLSMTNQFSALLGITQEELERFFAAHLQTFTETSGLSAMELIEQIRFWYNGFRFSSAGEAVYNPFALLRLFKNQEFRNYWFESGTPTFLIKLIQERNYAIERIGQQRLNEAALSAYDIENLQITPLLFQTGYLSIREYDPETRLYTLNYPNYEVEDAFLNHLLGSLSPVTTSDSADALWQLTSALRANDLTRFFQVLTVFFAQIDYTLHIKQERYYQTIFYLIFKLIGLRIAAEVNTERGRIDAVVELDADIYLFEFKLGGNARAALEQIKERGYALRYADRGKRVHLVGVNFDLDNRGIGEWVVETV